ncbi:MAG: HYR domain-containing protein [Lewinellaceae bacterium]|nr:HYR domain-containing protein [Lewinellaceae bacterium]
MKIQGLFPCSLLFAIALSVLPASPLRAFGGLTDYIPPTAVCDDQLNVSLTSAGTATVYAQSFDEGSYDNYCLAAVKVRRMDQPYAPFTNAVVFNCSDIGQLISVELKAIDCAGNTNSCWSQVWVEDKLAPQIWCPYNKTIACSQLNNWTAMGQATATDNCGVANISYTDVDNTTSCGTGYILRTWKATDIYGNMSSCVQTIHIFDNTPVVILFPPDTTFNDCITADDLDPGDLPPPYDRPRALYEDCEMLAYNYEDWVFTASANSCLKIIRRWRVIDWCTYQVGGNQGIWEDTQILKIKDNTPPVITCPDDIVKAVGANCRATVSMPPLSTVDDCLADVNVRIMGDLGEGATFNNVPVGEYTMTYVAKDGCLNTSSCSVNVSVVDATPPGVVCLNGVSFPLMANGEGMLWASDLERGSSSDNCTAYDNLEFRLGLQPAPGQTTPPDDDFLTFTCDDRGTNIVALWVGDEAGNWDYCITYAIVQDNQNICGPMPPGTLQARIAGLVIDEQGDEVPDVQVHIDSTATGAYEASTDSLGLYAFDDMPTGATYTLRPEKQSAPRDGITTVDLITLAKHVMGVDTLDTPYQFIAADINRSGAVDMYDMTFLHRLLLGQEDEFPGGLTWRFVPRSFSFPATDPLSADFPEELVVDNLAAPRTDADFIGVKLGDLDASLMSPPDSVQGRSASRLLSLQMEDRYLQAGEIAEVRLQSAQQDVLLGLHLILDHPGLELEEARFTGLEGSGGYRQGAAQSAFSWASGRNLELEEGREMAVLRFRAEQEGRLSDKLSLGQGTQAFREYEGIEAAGAELRFLAPAGGALAVRAFPNPFRDKAYLHLELPRAGNVRLSVWDAKGAVVHQAEWQLEAGRHQLAVEAARLGKPGAYIYKLESPLGETSGRLVLAP